MDFGMLSPEINSGRIYAGPGSGPMLAAAAAWDALSTELHCIAERYGSVVSGLTSGPWLGASSASMAAAAAPYVAWTTTTATQAEEAAAQAKTAAAAYEAVFAMTVPPPVVAANRSLLMTLVATNFLGQNTAAIAATEADYAEMWAQDAAAMYLYAASSAAASTLTPFTAPAPTTSPAGLAGQAVTAARAIMSGGPRTMSVLSQALQGLASPMSSAAALPSLPSLVSDPASALSTLGTLVTAVAIPVAAIDTVAASVAAPASIFSGSASSVSATTTTRALRINADRDFAKGDGPFTGDGPGAAMLPQWIAGGVGGAGTPLLTAASPVTAGMGQATAIGGISVPSGWASAATAFRPLAYTPITVADVGPEVDAASSDNLLSDLALAGMAGRAAGSTASLGHGNERIRTGRGSGPKPPQRSQGEPVTEIAAELQDLAARAQSLLARLRDCGLMDDQEVTAQKRRFLGI